MFHIMINAFTRFSVGEELGTLGMYARVCVLVTLSFFHLKTMDRILRGTIENQRDGFSC